MPEVPWCPKCNRIVERDEINRSKTDPVTGAVIARHERCKTGLKMARTFEARPLPEAIWVEDECIAGPFCVNCGWAFSQHFPDLTCRSPVHPLLGGRNAESERATA